MLTKADLEKLATARLADAILLLNSGGSSSAYYLAGYAVELGLKARIATLFRPNEIPDKAFVTAIYTHRFANLVSTAGLLPEFNREVGADPTFAANWAIANQWSEESRYEMWSVFSATALLLAISEPAHGVFQWIRRYW